VDIIRYPADDRELCEQRRKENSQNPSLCPAACTASTCQYRPLPGPGKLICLSSYISKPFGTIALSYWEILSFAATGPLLAAGMNAHLDLKFNGIRPGKKLTFRFLLAFLSVVIIVFYFTAYLTKTSRFFDLPPFLIFRHLSTALTLCCFTIGLFILSMLVFEHRKSYLE
jgi:hypothetical protein